MKEKLADLIFFSIRESRSIEELAERLVDRGVQIVPEGAMILTKAELDALNNYEKCRMQNAECRVDSEVAEEIFAEIEETLSPTISALFMISETLVDVSKSHISEEKAIKDIRNYLHNAICSKYQLEKALAELKKKYTESEGE